MSDLVYTGDMADVEELCGREVADQVSETLSGIYLYVPTKPKDESPWDKLDEEVAATLCREFGGSLIYVSKARTPPPDPVEAKRLLAEGLSVIDVALKMGASDRWVRKVRDRSIPAPSDPRQLPLFRED